MKTEDLNKLEKMRKEFEAGEGEFIPGVPLGATGVSGEMRPLLTGDTGAKEESTTEEFEKFLVKRAEAAEQL